MPTKKPAAKNLLTAPRRSLAQLIRDNQELSRERDESLEREAATGDILRMIARAPADIQAVLDGIAERAARLCDAEDAAIFRVDGNLLLSAAHFGPVPMVYAVGEGRVFDRGIPAGRAVIDRQTIHVPDLPAAVKEFPGAKTSPSRWVSAPCSRRHCCATALLSGLFIFAERRSVLFSQYRSSCSKPLPTRPSSPSKTRGCFKNSLRRWSSRRRRVRFLGVIASSPTDIQPVLDTVVKNAARVCGANDAVIRLVQGDFLRAAAHFGPVPEVADARPINRHSPAGRAVVDRTVIHIPDWNAVAASDYPEVRDVSLRTGIGTALAVPLLRENVAIGEIHIRRQEVRPFTDKQIKLA